MPRPITPTRNLTDAELLQHSSCIMYYHRLFCAMTTYVRCMVSTSYYSILILLDCSAGGASPPPGAEDFILVCYTRFTSIATSSIVLLVSS